LGNKRVRKNQQDAPYEIDDLAKDAVGDGNMLKKAAKKKKRDFTTHSIHFQ
jgi:hypothetical protein